VSKREGIIEHIKRSDRRGYWFVSPYLIFFCLFVAYPLVFSFVLIFHRWDIVTPMEWVGLKNFDRLISDTLFFKAVGNTLVFLLLHIPLQIVVALLLAVLLNSKIRARGFFRSLYFLPVVVSPSIAIMATWKNVGIYIVLFMAGLQGIPRDLYESASIDGASNVNQFFRITLPMLNPAIVVVVVLSTINGFSLFIEPYVMTGGGPMQSTLSAVLYIYNQAFYFGHMGYAATLGLVFAIVILVVVLIQRKVTEAEPIS
jgi:ABC-type sugar transport system permease subunit